MSDWEPTNEQITGFFAMFWRLLEIQIRRYGACSMGQLLNVTTIILLDRVNHHPTVGELADITGMPKSSVSRYVSMDMNGGFLEEVIDPEDRRRRRLHPTQKAREEQAWQVEQIMKAMKLSVDTINDISHTENSAADLKQIFTRYR